jgi:outer membrane protein TolC
MRWKLLCGTVALLLAASAGCKQRCYLTEADMERTMTTSLDGFELKPDLSAQALTPFIPEPPTLNNLDRRIRYISLAECVAIALEQGKVGQPSLLFPGTAQDNLVQFTGRGIAGSDAIRVLALDPARAASDIEASLSKFDAVFSASMQWQTTDQPIGTSLDTIRGGGATAINQQDATFSSTIAKPLATGGAAGITFTVPYQFTNLPARVNPSYRPQLIFQFDQPLMQGFGVEINQLRSQHPILGTPLGALRGAGQFQPGSEGILITRLRFDQQRAEFERQVNQMLLNVEVAYWNLYGAYWQVYSREQGLRFAFEAYRLTKSSFEAGRAIAADLVRTRGAYEQFRAQRLQAIATVLENERQLRSLLGMEASDGTRLMPSDSPTLTPFKPDWDGALADALTKRPELYMTRQEIKAAQMQLILAKNQLMPDVRFTATYDINSLGTRLDGAGTPLDLPGGGQRDINAFRGLSDNLFNNWSIGIIANVPIGYRLAHTQVRQAQLALARALETLKDGEQKAKSFLQRYYFQMSLTYEQIRATRAQREAAAEQLRTEVVLFQAGRNNPERSLDAQRQWADALANEFQAIVAYNNAISGFEYAKGTIMQHNNVFIAEGPLPACASVRAVEHEKQRTAALVLRERAAPAAVTPVGCKTECAGGKAPTLPAAMAATPPLKDVPALPSAEPGRPTELPVPQEHRPEELLPMQPLPTGTTKAPAGQSSPNDKPLPTGRPAAAPQERPTAAAAPPPPPKGVFSQFSADRKAP